MFFLEINKIIFLGCDDHSIPENIVDNDVVNDDLKFLENYIEPWDTVVAKWRETVQTRRELKNLDPSDYMSKFPALLSARGYELVISFNMILKAQLIICFLVLH